jgi:hypothetical protein
MAGFREIAAPPEGLVAVDARPFPIYVQTLRPGVEEVTGGAQWPRQSKGRSSNEEP